MRTLVKRKLRETAASENYMIAVSAETIEEDNTGNSDTSPITKCLRKCKRTAWLNTKKKS